MSLKFKLDENFGRTVQALFKDRGFDAQTVRDERLQGAKDSRVLQAASGEKRILVTMDQDFANVLLFSVSGDRPGDSAQRPAVLPGDCSVRYP